MTLFLQTLELWPDPFNGMLLLSFQTSEVQTSHSRGLNCFLLFVGSREHRIKQRPSIELLQKRHVCMCFSNQILCYISGTRWAITLFPPLRKESPDSWSLQVIKQKEVNQFSLLTKILESLSHWKNEQFPCSVLAFFSYFGFSVSMDSFSSNIFKQSNICCRPLRIHSP